jgi:hypothetical protein
MGEKNVLNHNTNYLWLNSHILNIFQETLVMQAGGSTESLVEELH